MTAPSSRLYTDMMGTEVMLPCPPKRIVSLVPSQTELLHYLGLQTQVVGITKFCIHPQEWFMEKARVGGTKNVKYDKVAALSPDLIIANKEENDEKNVNALRSLAPVWVSDIQNLPQALQMIAQIGNITGTATEAQQLLHAIAQAFGDLTRSAPLIPAAYLIWRNPWMAAGGDTFIHNMLAFAGYSNVLAHTARYPSITLEALAALAPQAVLLSSEPYPFAVAHIAEIKQAMPNAKVHLIDGEMMSWYGSRLLLAADYIRSRRWESEG
ncbi:MAG: cobalamin-binding protein [Chitinophagia bacterium]|nr:cobalamin-binding protein [Chitinophagia bacterium]